MNEATIIISTLAILFSLIALIVGCVAIAMVCGFLRSTHTIQWKPLDAPFLQGGSDSGEEAPEELDPQKKLKPQDFAFMEDVADHNNW